MSDRELILNAIKTKLANANVAGGRVYRSRRQALQVLPAVVVEPSIRRTKQEHTGAAEDNSFIVNVLIFVEGDPPDTVSAPIEKEVVAALKADPTLGVADDVQLQGNYETSWDFEDFDVARVYLTFQVNYRETP